jgi:hypothetical protein
MPWTFPNIYFCFMKYINSVIFSLIRASRTKLDPCSRIRGISLVMYLPTANAAHAHSATTMDNPQTSRSAVKCRLWKREWQAAQAVHLSVSRSIQTAQDLNTEQLRGRSSASYVKSIHLACRTQLLLRSFIASRVSISHVYLRQRLWRDIIPSFDCII